MMGLSVYLITIAPEKIGPSCAALIIGSTPFFYIPFLFVPYLFGAVGGMAWDKWAKSPTLSDEVID
jgi:hypothetical protein